MLPLLNRMPPMQASRLIILYGRSIWRAASIPTPIRGLEQRELLNSCPPRPEGWVLTPGIPSRRYVRLLTLWLVTTRTTAAITPWLLQPTTEDPAPFNMPSIHVVRTG